MSTINGITYVEQPNSPRLSGDGNGTRLTREFLLPDWSRYEDFVSLLMGAHRVTFTDLSAGTAEVELIAEPLPVPGWNNLYCDSWSAAPYKQQDAPAASSADILKSTLITAYTGQCLITANYSQRVNNYTEVHPKNSDVLGGASGRENTKGTWLSLESDEGGEIIQTGYGVFHWVGASTTPESDYLVGANIHPGIVVPSTIHSLTWHNCIAPPEKTIRQTVGKVNTDEILFGAVAGTLLFLGAQKRQMFRFQGGAKSNASPGTQAERPYYDVTYRFAQQNKFKTDGTTPVGWNFLYRAAAISSEHWVEIKDVDSNTPHKSTNFVNLFSYGC